jgi:monofunctional biosynthetic peptidoglycan transglycosylase
MKDQSKKKPHILLRILKILFLIIVSLLITYAIVFSIAGTVAIYVSYQYIAAPFRQVKALKKDNPKESAYMISYRETLKRDSLPDTLYQQFIPLDSISKNLRNAVIAAEDDGFYTHPGFDIEAILSAYEYNKSKGKVKRGASTITQQLAKNLFLTGERSFERKFKELIYTVLMERYLGKDRILELYLNYAQWGKNIFGCEAASKHFFKKSSANLNRVESARLASVLAMPSKVSPNNIQSSFISRRMAVIANNLYIRGVIDDTGYFDLTGMYPPRKASDSLSDTSSQSMQPSDSDVNKSPAESYVPHPATKR